jgi:hypothetical protein
VGREKCLSFKVIGVTLQHVQWDKDYKSDCNIKKKNREKHWPFEDDSFLGCSAV